MKPSHQQKITVYPRLVAATADRLRDEAHKRGGTPSSLAAEIVEKWVHENLPDPHEEVAK